MVEEARSDDAGWQEPERLEAERQECHPLINHLDAERYGWVFDPDNRARTIKPCPISHPDQNAARETAAVLPEQAPQLNNLRTKEFSSHEDNEDNEAGRELASESCEEHDFIDESTEKITVGDPVWYVEQTGELLRAIVLEIGQLCKIRIDTQECNTSLGSIFKLHAVDEGGFDESVVQWRAVEDHKDHEVSAGDRVWYKSGPGEMVEATITSIDRKSYPVSVSILILARPCVTSRKRIIHRNEVDASVESNSCTLPASLWDTVAALQRIAEDNRRTLTGLMGTQLSSFEDENGVKAGDTVWYLTSAGIEVESTVLVVHGAASPPSCTIRFCGQERVVDCRAVRRAAGIPPASVWRPSGDGAGADSATTGLSTRHVRLRGIAHKVEVLTSLIANVFDTRKMKDVDSCIGITKPGVLSLCDPFGSLSGSNIRLPWFNFDFRSPDVTTFTARNMSELPPGAHIGVDHHLFGATARVHAIYIGRISAQMTATNQALSDGCMVDVPSVVCMTRPEHDYKLCNVIVCSLAHFRNGSAVYLYESSPRAVARALDCVTGSDLPFDWFHANSEHWASWCVSGQYRSREAELAKKVVQSRAMQLVVGLTGGVVVAGIAVSRWIG